MKRFLTLSLLILLLIPFTGCDPFYFTIRFANTGTTDIIEVYMAPEGGQYGDNLLPVAALYTDEYFILEGLNRWSDYDVKVVFDVLDTETQANFEWVLKNNVPAAPPDDFVSFTAYYNISGSGTSYGISYSWGWVDNGETFVGE